MGTELIVFFSAVMIRKYYLSLRGVSMSYNILIHERARKGGTRNKMRDGKDGREDQRIAETYWDYRGSHGNYKESLTEKEKHM